MKNVAEEIYNKVIYASNTKSNYEVSVGEGVNLG